jgi:hypothetical protein
MLKSHIGTQNALTAFSMPIKFGVFVDPLIPNIFTFWGPIAKKTSPGPQNPKQREPWCNQPLTFAISRGLTIKLYLKTKIIKKRHVIFYQ